MENKHKDVVRDAPKVKTKGMQSIKSQDLFENALKEALDNEAVVKSEIQIK